MTLEAAAFWIIAIYTLFAAYFVVTARNLFRCAVGLAAVLIGIAGLYLIMDAQFLSAIQIAVYVGGVVVLVVFAVLMVEDVTQKEFLRSPLSRCMAAALIVELLLVIVAGSLLTQGFGKVRPEPAAAQVREIGRALLSTAPGGFVLPFEVISLVLVAALVGAITVAGRPTDVDKKEEAGD
jgi:NADH-quinone oxidoreductase subunit J